MRGLRAFPRAWLRYRLRNGAMPLLAPVCRRLTSRRIGNAPGSYLCSVQHPLSQNYQLDFSVSAKITKREATEINAFKRNTDLVVAAPIGSLTSSTWAVATRLFFYWIQKKKEPSKEWIVLAWRLMDRLVEEERSRSATETIIPSQWLFRLVDAWRKECLHDGSTVESLSPEHILARVDSYAPHVMPDARVYSMLVDTCTKTSSDHGKAAHFAQSLLARMLRDCKTNPLVTPNSVMFTTVIDAWARSGLSGAPYKAEAILKEMMHSSSNVEPTLLAVSTVLNAWAKSSVNGAAARAERILEQLEDSHWKLDAQCYGTVIAAFASSGKPSRAESLLQRLHDLYRRTGDERLKPSVVEFNSTILAWANQGDAGRAESLMREMQKLSDELDVKPDAITFNTIIHGWARSSDPSAAQHAEAILQEMQQLYEAGYASLKPDIISFSSVISAWSKSNDMYAAKKAEAILRRRHELYEAGESTVKPNTFTFSAVISAWAKSPHPKAAQHAESILRWMQELHEGGDVDVKPNTITYSSVVSAWANSGDPKAPQRAEALLREMQQRHKAGDLDAKPNHVTYSAVLNAFANSRDVLASQKAESILEEMQQSEDTDVKPNAISFGTVIAAWARSQDQSAVERALQHLEVMKHLEASGQHDCSPTIITYNTIINVVSTNPSPDAIWKAHELLKEAHELADKGEKNMQPNATTYSTLLKAIALSQLPNKSERAEKLLRNMQKRSVEPNIIVLDEVLHCCAHVHATKGDRASAFRVAQDTLRWIRQSEIMASRPITYIYYFRACENATQHDEAELKRAIEWGYEQCCQDGLERNPRIRKAFKHQNARWAVT